MRSFDFEMLRREQGDDCSCCGDTEGRRGPGRGIVDAVPGHARLQAEALVALHDEELVLREHLGEPVGASDVLSTGRDWQRCPRHR